MTAPAEQLPKLLALLSSPHDGEVIAAARAAERLRTRLGVQWSDLVALPNVGKCKAERNSQRPATWQAQLRLCRDHRDRLTDWERQFVGSLLRFNRPTPRQLAVLGGITDRLTGGAR